MAKASDYWIEDIKPEKVRVRIYGDQAAVVNGRLALTEQINYRGVTNRIQVTQTWIMRQGSGEL
jgi:hypothetical protein